MFAFLFVFCNQYLEHLLLCLHLIFYLNLNLNICFCFHLHLRLDLYLYLYFYLYLYVFVFVFVFGDQCICMLPPNPLYLSHQSPPLTSRASSNKLVAARIKLTMYFVSQRDCSHFFLFLARSHILNSNGV